VNNVQSRNCDSIDNVGRLEIDISMSIDKRKTRKNTFGVLYLIDNWHREFDYVTACYLLEPWERRLVKGTFIALASVIWILAFIYFVPYCSNVVAQYMTPAN